MAVRQYIGARYVPIIAGEWDSSVNYEPLTVVTDTMGNSYMSRKDVPAGTPLSDRNFWVLTSNYSQQVGSLSERMTAAEGTIEQQGQTLEAIASETLISERKFLFQGDSYLMQSPSWGDLTASFLGLSAGSYEKLAGSGAGFVSRGSTTNQNFIEQLEAFTGTGFTDVIVAAGANDRTQLPNNIKTAIYAYAQKVREKFGDNCKLWIAMCANSKTEGVRIWSYCFDAFKTGAAEAGAAFIGDAAFALSSFSEFIDYLHPSAAGSENIALAISNAIRGCARTPYSKSSTGTCTLLVGTYDSAITARSIGNDSFVQYWILPASGTLDLRLSTPVTWTARNYYDLLQLPDDVLFAVGGVAYGQCICRIRSADDTSQYVAMDVKLRLTADGKLQMSPSEGVANIDIIRCGNIFMNVPMRRAV